MSAFDVPLSAVRAFYSDQFVLPLTAGHSFPMATCARLRERPVATGVPRLDELVEAGGTHHTLDTAAARSRREPMPEMPTRSAGALASAN